MWPGLCTASATLRPLRRGAGATAPLHRGSAPPRDLRKFDIRSLRCAAHHRNRILDRSARYSEIVCSRLKPEISRARAWMAVIRSSAPPLGPWPLLFDCCSAEVCGLSISSAIAIVGTSAICGWLERFPAVHSRHHQVKQNDVRREISRPFSQELYQASRCAFITP
jgi:hypothetical protein